MVKVYFLVGYLCTYLTQNYLDPHCTSFAQKYDTQEKCKQDLEFLDLTALELSKKTLTTHKLACLEAPIKTEGI
jgi:hypothetical protein